MKLFEGLYSFLWNSMSANNCNTFLINGPSRVLIDPGHLQFFPHIESGLREVGLSTGAIDLIISTHGHPDHVEAVKLFKGTSTLFAMHEGDDRILKVMGRYLNGASFEKDAYIPDFFLQEGDLLIKGMRLQVLHTPGHSPGSICLYWPEKKALFTGDLIFKDGLGRTDLMGGDGDLLKQSIKRLSGLDAEWLLPGHGDIISGADEVRNNLKRVEQLWFGYI
ncbi:MAG: MBL fold metallo-hydrolase [Syntrophobacteraceae bacterium]